MNIDKSTVTRSAIAAAVFAALSACHSLPDRVDSLEQARLAVRSAEQDPLASQVAATQLAAARSALDDADSAYRQKEPIEQIEHDAYVAQRYADISKQRIGEARAKQQIAENESERNRVLLESRSREADLAEQRSRENEARGDAADEQARLAQEQARAAEDRNRSLEQELAGLQAKQTERGLVLTLGDVLFDTAKSTLKPGAGATMDRLAAFMGDNPERQVLIEGHTDARGADDYNQRLSEARADAVRAALVTHGIDPQRIRSVGLGEAYPVASNDDAAGMQQNRRVEIVISDASGGFPGAALRSASTRN